MCSAILRRKQQLKLGKHGAGHAFANCSPSFTRDRKRFPRVPGLKLVNMAESISELTGSSSRNVAAPD